MSDQRARVGGVSASHTARRAAIAALAAASFLYAPAGSGADAGPYRVRLTETSITETGYIVGARSIDLKTKGYGFTVIHPVGLGLSYTDLMTRGDDETTKLRHRYVDASYTFGPSWLVSFGTGVVVKGDATARGEESTKATGAAYFLGPGYAFGHFEIYWICRLNQVRYAYGDDALNARLRHCQLGLGANF